MSSVVVVGAQWGDEAKAKVIDIFTEFADLIVRFQGGSGGGRALTPDHKDDPGEAIPHLLPSGVLRSGKRYILGPGVVLDPEALLQEIDALTDKRALSRDDALTISEAAHVIMPYHRRFDQAREGALGKVRQGTTGRGVGPCCEDRIARRGVLVRDLLDPACLRRKLQRLLPEKNLYLDWRDSEPVDLDETVETFAAFGERLAPRIRPVGRRIFDAVRQGKRVLFEGAEGTMLDVNHGAYPFVSSVHTTSAGVCVGTGVPPHKIDAVIGVCKAYTSRLDAGPFPTELFGDIGERLKEGEASEGAAAESSRRCGWLDVVALRYAVRVNGLTGLAITRLDALTGLDEVKICVGYELEGEEIDEPPLDPVALDGTRPVYETIPGWSEPLSDIRNLAELPRTARHFLSRISSLVGVPIVLVSVGPTRSETIMLSQPFRYGRGRR